MKRTPKIIVHFNFIFIKKKNFLSVRNMSDQLTDVIIYLLNNAN
jgi:hypothetical protein